MNEFKDINLLTCNDRKYPEKLKQIVGYPVCLFCKGDISLLHEKSIAIIGSRKCTAYGKQVTSAFANGMAKKGFTIISGGARGIDTFAHLGALAVGGKTIMVLGNSLEYVYPPENKNLEERILRNGGLIVSEYMTGTRPSKYTFPQRNRIISGLSDGVLVIEAMKSSGALITVDFALEQGKNVFAVPGNITSKCSIGSNDIIKQGAKLVTTLQDIFEEYEY